MYTGHTFNILMAAPVKERVSIVSQQSSQDTGDVRAVVDLQTDKGQSVYVVTTSRDKTARVWLREDQREYKTAWTVRVYMYYSNTRGSSRVPVWYMLRPSLGEKNVRMTTRNCVLVNWAIVLIVIDCDE